MKTKPHSQNAKVLALLRDNRRRWVPMPAIATLCQTLNVHSRIAELRKAGLFISNKIMRDGERKLSFYKLG